MNELKPELDIDRDEMTVTQIQELIGLRKGDRDQPSLEEDVIAAPDSPPTPKIAKNPYLKLLTVALFTGIGFAVVALFLSLKPSVRLNSVSESPSPKSSVNRDRPKTKEELLEEENATLKAKLALTQQGQLQKVKQQLDNPEAEKASLIKIEKPSEPNKPAPITLNRKQRMAASPVFVRSPIRRSYNQPYREVLSTRAIAPPPGPSFSRSFERVSTTTTPHPTPSPDTYKNWQELAQLGNYGEPMAQENLNSSNSKRQEKITEAAATETTEVLPPTKTVGSDPGQAAVGKLKTPIVWAQGLENAPCVVELEQPLLNAQGTEVLPSQSILVFTVKSVHSSGLVIAESQKAIVNGQEYPIPPGALSLARHGGSPLMAKLENPSSGNAVRNGAMTFLLGGLGKTGEIMNRATSSSTFNGISGSSQNVEYGSPNYLGSILEGGLEPLQEQIAKQNENQQKEILSRSPLWIVEQSLKVQIIVLNSFSLNLIGSGVGK